MSATLTEQKVLKGGEFLIKDSNYQEMFIPEDFNEEQLMVKETVRSFVHQEILPVVDRIEKLEEGLIPSILENFAQLGLLGTHMPEDLGGSNLDYITNTLIGEEVGPSGSFSVSYNAHTGIGMLPILYYGTEARGSVNGDSRELSKERSRTRPWSLAKETGRRGGGRSCRGGCCN